MFNPIGALVKLIKRKGQTGSQVTVMPYVVQRTED